jgi:hypothetical protein
LKSAAWLSEAGEVRELTHNQITFENSAPNMGPARHNNSIATSATLRKMLFTSTTRKDKTHFNGGHVRRSDGCKADRDGWEPFASQPVAWRAKRSHPTSPRLCGRSLNKG